MRTLHTSDKESTIWVDNRGISVHLSVTVWSNMLNKMFEHSGLRRKVDLDPETQCTPHSLRRAAAQWAARCGAKVWEIKDCGQWKSTVFLRYMEETDQEKSRLSRQGVNDKVFSVWVWKPVN